ncbi:hypothetical protein HHK36_023048 [Tetracentron sinense]|uniref:Kinesin motor domain-containing protein n=1 Tax=Tetracentron sinense TaxID=13715 RepID=A0A834YNV3_TETSI|nr:hypothetical protein HHK36_023048 [Tetracentron sinense]
MSRDISSFRFVGRNTSRNTQSEGNENEFENPVNLIHFPPPRTPLNTIPDPSQNPREIHELESDSRSKFEGSRVGRSSDRKIEAFEYTLPLNKGIGNMGSNYGTPRTANRGKAHSEPNSAQSTPARSVSKVSNVGALGACTGYRFPQYTGARGGSSSRVSRGMSIASAEPTVEVPHFELVEDPSFWTDHNVQVLIRIRPISAAERTSLGYTRCLRQESSQTLTWLGHPETRFTFDHIVCETISQEELFKVAGLPMVENCMSGYNSCMFAYGQTGSGKTYTMMGEVYEMDGKLNEDCGITPRIFEYLFARIRAEEENRSEEKLNYSCKCSFLEIYNEQITDLLEPSSTNLQLREDIKKGVYVENLVEYEVNTVNDVIKLLLQGAANRKIAATHMNSESSRSHSVFTCIIESRWEKDSMTHLRFGRLNLVDLAGSERQKSSGAEGERLKEAANINKSLSTLGLVIMTLVDVAHGKHRHIPYRDSRLTFLLQDSLGGNSKTTIIANVSPSICSANETLSTLKFAQRAKLIQNNAKVNEDASGDVMALQRQIQHLKGQLTFLLKHHNLSRSLSLCLPSFEQSRLGDFPQECDSSGEGIIPDNHNKLCIPKKKMKCMEATLVGALRREKIAETAVRKLEAEIEHMNRLVHQRENDAQRTKMILRFREEKIKRLELLADGLMSADMYLMEENNALSEEIELLQARIDRNPELTRFALENIRLLEQLRLFQDFYEHGERETLLAEVSELRDELLKPFKGTNVSLPIHFSVMQNIDTIRELEDCRKINAKLAREVDELRRELKGHWDCNKAAFHSVTDNFCRDDDIFKQTNEHSLVEIISVRSDSEDHTTSYNQADDEVLQMKNELKLGDALVMQLKDTEKDLIDAKLLIEAMESEQVRLFEEVGSLRADNCRYMKVLSNRDNEEMQSMFKLESQCEQSERYLKTENLGHRNESLVMGGRVGTTRSALEAKLNRMIGTLEEARILNRQSLDDQASQLSHQHEVEQFHEQVEVETSKMSLHLQEEVTTLRQEFQEENTRLRNTIASKEDEIRTLSVEWEKATLNLTSFLVDGCKSLEDASDQIESIACSFPQGKVWIGEHVERAAKVFVENEDTIVQLQKSLEDSQKMALDMKLKLGSLKGATIAITEVQQLENDDNAKEAIQLRTMLKEKICLIKGLESKLKYKEDQILEAEKRADAAFIVAKRLSDFPKEALRKDAEKENPELKLATYVEQDAYWISEMKAHANAQILEAIEVQIDLARQRVLESENAIYASYADAELHLSALQTDILETSSAFTQLVQDLTTEIHVMKKNFMEMKEHYREIQYCTVESSSFESHKSPKLEDPYHLVQQIRDELAETNDRLKVIKTCFDSLLNVYGSSETVGDLVKAERQNVDCFNPGSDLSIAHIAPKDNLDESLSPPFCSGCPEKLTEQKWDLISRRDSAFVLDDQELRKSQKPEEKLIRNNATIMCLRKEVELAFNGFLELYVWLTTLFEDKELRNCSSTQVCFPESLAPQNDNQFYMDQRERANQVTMLEMYGRLQSSELKMEEAESGCLNTKEMFWLKLSDASLVADEKIKRASSFLVKFEESQATIKEADIMLNVLLRENANAKHMTSRWKQAGEELMIERASLIEEIQQLKSSIHLKEGEHELLQSQIQYSLVEIMDSMSLLHGSFLQMQRDVEERFKVIYSDTLSFGRELLDCICNSRSSLEDIWSEIMEKGFALFVLYQCHIGEFFGKISSLNEDPGFHQYRQEECLTLINNLEKRCLCAKGDGAMVKCMKGIEELSIPGQVLPLKHSFEVLEKLKEEELGLIRDNPISENLSLKRELGRKDELLKGLLFDFSLLQESTSNTKDIKDEMEHIITALIQVRQELAVKTTHLDDILVQHGKLEGWLADSEAALSISNSELEQTKGTLDMLSNQNTELRDLLEDLYFKKTDAEEQLEEQKEVVKGLETEILRMTSSVEENIISSRKDIEDELRRVTGERDHLHEEESEASKIYAEQKEEEVKILERSIEELECTINVLEKKVYEMDVEVARHRLMRDNLELEVQALRQRMLTVENVKENRDSEYPYIEQRMEDQILRHVDNRTLELHEAHNRIRVLEKERAEQAEEIKQGREYISELILHAEAQASQYQQKYKTLEAMVREVKTDSSTSTCAAPTLDKTDKSSTRTRGSSSPFRCIASLVQQMNLEKDQELSMARLRIEELEALAASRQKEVCMLNARLAAAESMTHDVIRDLLGVKLDMTNYANLIDQHQVQKLVEEAQQQTEDSVAKEQEILNLRKQINDLIEERQSCIEEINQREADILAAQVKVEQLQQRDQFLIAQNEMLKMDNTNLKRRIAELDEMDNSLVRVGNVELTKRLAQSEKLLSRVNDELAQYRKSDGRNRKTEFDQPKALDLKQAIQETVTGYWKRTGITLACEVLSLEVVWSIVFRELPNVTGKIML